MQLEIAAFFDQHHLPHELAADLAARLGASTLATLGDTPSVELSEFALDSAAPKPPSRAAPTVRDEIPARYEDLGRLGVGGMGEVRRVRDRELGRVCALSDPGSR